ncbi:MAG TPA: DUF1573 domain-containing protein [Candidatus Kryptonia bacterium]
MHRLMIIVFIVAAAAQISLSQPKLIAVGSGVIDAGSVYNTGKSVEVFFRLKNDGDKPVHISQVRTSCGCTAALLSDSVLAPGQKTSIKVDFNPTGYIGDVTKNIYVVSDDPSNHMLTLELHAHISYALQATPNFILFPNAKVGETDSAFVTLTNTSSGSMEILSVEPDRNEITSSFDRRVVVPGENVDLKLFVRGEKAEALSGIVQVKTTSELQPVLVLRYYAVIR